jgi:hypothetical protein
VTIPLPQTDILIRSQETGVSAAEKKWRQENGKKKSKRVD